VDPYTGAPWVVCSATLTSIWISASETCGNYHVEQICKSLGYTKVAGQGNNYGSVCGYNQGTTSCTAPGNEYFDNNASILYDANGMFLSGCVEWSCTN
jgi:hypothetical protein